MDLFMKILLILRYQRVRLVLPSTCSFVDLTRSYPYARSSGDSRRFSVSAFLKRQREEPGMGYVVRAASASGVKMWIAQSPPKCQRAFGPREKAEIFRTQKEAQAVIDTLADTFRRVGFEFDVETAG
jgi:hypothetical protein